MTQPILNITNGDCAVDRLQTFGIEGPMLPWRDVLHEGPVPSGLTREAYCDMRAEFLSQTYSGHSMADIAAGMRERYAWIETAPADTRYMLWFEPDLYDQLQLLEVLHVLHALDRPDTSVWIQDQRHYWALTSDEDLQGCVGHELPVSPNTMAYAADAWDAFRETTPQGFQTLCRESPEALPYLAAAAERLLCEYPHPDSGLTLTESRALQHLRAAGACDAGQIFKAVHEQEDAPFMGNTSFYAYLEAMTSGDTPLLRREETPLAHDPLSAQTRLALTREGENLIDGKHSCLSTRVLDLWRGGVHINNENCWTYDPDSSRLAQK